MITTDWPAVIRAILDRDQISAVELSRRLRVNDRTMRRWLAGERTPLPRVRDELMALLAATT